jgi:uncharacterized protein YyaL (SSP411 family)
VNIIGDEMQLRLHEFSGYYLPGVIFSGKQVLSTPEMIESSLIKGNTLIYVCRDRTCFSPVETVHDALQILLQV